MAKILLCYPSGEMFQRGEDRCQSNIKASTSTSMRACNDLGYMAAVLDRHCHVTAIRDYQTEGKTFDDMVNDITQMKADFVVISTTNATVFDDIETVNKLKSKIGFDFEVVLKGAIFYDAPDDLLKQLDLRNIDVLVGGEIEFVIQDIVELTDLSEVPGIFYKDAEGNWHKNKFNCWNDNLDDLPFPKRSAMNNALYVRPDTGEPMATIQTARGCPSQCIYCLTPKISGRCVRSRSPQNVFDEVKECFYEHNIRNFFFKADTFTINKDWVLEFCDLIKESDLMGKIAYTVNSRVKPISKEVLQALKDTGCFTIAFGFETGSEETMRLIKKGATIEDNKRAMALCKEVGLPVFGFFMIGFPWENMEHIEATKKHIFELKPDFLELHVALPYYGSQFYDLCKDEGVLSENVIGTDYFHSSTKGTKYLTIDQLLEFRKKLLMQYHCRPSYIFKKIKDCGFNPKIICNYAKFGFRLIGNVLRK